MSKRDYYEVLGIDKSAGEGEIKKAYRKAAVKHHPDKNPNDPSAEEKFKEAAEAYEVLSNGDKKARYDRFGHAGMSGAAGGGGGGFHGGGMNMEDIFSQFGDIFGGGFGGGGGRQRAGRRRVNRGSNLRIKMKMTLEEIAEGVEKKVKVNKDVGCGTCDGSGSKGGEMSSCSSCGGSGQVTRVQNTILGQMQTTATCPSCGGQGQTIKDKCGSCHGNGILKEHETITLKIPAGVEDGMELSISGQGNAGARNGVNGDLHVLIEEVPHDDFVRDGDNLHFDHYLSITDAIFGASSEIPVLGGKVKIKIEAGTQGGKLLRLRGKGIPNVNGYGPGDLMVHLNVWTPQSLNKEEKEILGKLVDSENFIPSPTKKDKGFFEKMKEFF
ncbi:MAG: molecular chaperone DnaJ [Flavobacteriales bacterium]|nr:molecular chaperone DnaJ [Flavobacteriales bacterium]